MTLPYPSPMLRAMRQPAVCRPPNLGQSFWAMGLLFTASVATAAPEASDDVVSRFLVDKGLIATTVAASAPTESEFVRQVRNKASEMVLTAMNFLGVPYRRGGSSTEAGFDCSGFTRHVFEMSLGLVLPRRADEQARAPGMFAIKREELKPGDLVFFNTLKRAFSHVGIYIGDGKFIHSPRTGAEVRVEDMRLAYWARRFNGARRAEPVAPDPDPGTGAGVGVGTADPPSPEPAATRVGHKPAPPVGRPH